MKIFLTSITAGLLLFTTSGSVVGQQYDDSYGDYGGDYQDYAGDYGQQDNLYHDYAQRQQEKQA